MENRRFLEPVPSLSPFRTYGPLPRSHLRFGVRALARKRSNIFQRLSSHKKRADHGKVRSPALARKASLAHERIECSKRCSVSSKSLKVRSSGFSPSGGLAHQRIENPNTLCYYKPQLAKARTPNTTSEPQYGYPVSLACAHRPTTQRDSRMA